MDFGPVQCTKKLKKYELLDAEHSHSLYSKYIALFFLVFITLYPLKFALEDAVGRVPCKFEN